VPLNIIFRVATPIFWNPGLLLLPVTKDTVLNQGANTVKWTALDPCSGLCESDPKLYTNFDLYEIKTHKHLESI
jgi:hypothetical protein